MLFVDTLADWCSFFKHRRGRGRGCAGRACQLLCARCGGSLLAACSGELCPTYPIAMALALPLCFCAAVYLIYLKDLTLLAYKHRAASGSIWRLPYGAAKHMLFLSFSFLSCLQALIRCVHVKVTPNHYLVRTRFSAAIVPDVFRHTKHIP